MKGLLLQFGIDIKLTHIALNKVFPMDRKVIVDMVYYIRGITKDHRNFVKLEEKKIVNTFHHCLPVFLHMYRNYKKGRDIFHNLEDLKVDGRTHDFNFIRKSREHVETNLAEIDLDQYEFVGLHNIERTNLLLIIALFWFKLNRPDVKLICGGNWFDVNEVVTKMFLELELIDLVIYGDGEILPDVYKESGEIWYCHKDIDDIPDPVLQPVPWRIHYDMPDPYALYFYATKGCLNRCSFCMQGMDRYRRVSSFSLVMDKLEEAVGKTGNKLLFCADNIWLGDMISECYVEFNKRGHLGDWSFEHVNVHPKTCTPTNVKMMKETGMHPFLGVESFNTRILQLMNKKTTKEDNLEAIDRLEKAGVPYTMGRIFQFPSETLEEFHESLREYTKIFTRNPNSRFLGTFTLCPKTDIYNNPEKYGIEMVYFGEDIENMVPALTKYVKQIPVNYIDQADPDNIKFNKCAKTIKLVNEKIGKIFPL